jgi:hypothetical protein
MLDLRPALTLVLAFVTEPGTAIVPGMKGAPPQPGNLLPGEQADGAALP